MKKTIILFFLIQACTFIPNTKNNFSSNIKVDANKAIVTIYAYDNSNNIINQGTGFVIHNRGIIATTWRTVESSNTIVIEFANDGFAEPVKLLFLYINAGNDCELL